MEQHTNRINHINSMKLTQKYPLFLQQLFHSSCIVFIPGDMIEGKEGRLVFRSYPLKNLFFQYDGKRMSRG